MVYAHITSAAAIARLVISVQRTGAVLRAAVTTAVTTAEAATSLL
jgi:hypothetical protein